MAFAALLTSPNVYIIYLNNCGNALTSCGLLHYTSVDTETITAYVGIGSNLGDRAGNLLLAVRGLLEASFEVTKLSAIYETEPVDIEDSADFLNMVAEIRAESITPSQMMARMLRIEYLLGRKDKSLKKPRTIDMDLLFYGDVTTDSPFLTLPHPRMHLRNFVLVPMTEIAPALVHPLLHKDVRTLLGECRDESAVMRWNPMSTKAEMPVLPSLQEKQHVP
ncbi:MAG: 2-amino-4-hydroxy-6-hydroxymethyldihydropteridine diphosphokinase [Blastocatellia bacterium]